MDRSRFTEKATGRLVRTEVPLKDWAFVPNRLPPKWDFDIKLWPLLAEAKEALGTLNGIGQTLSDPHLLLRPLQSREAIASSSIEGTYVTPEQLLLYELNPRDPKSAHDRVADWHEVLNYAKALEHGCKMLDTLPVCNRVILQMHGILMRGVRGWNKSPEQFRRCQVQIGSSGRFIPAPWTEVEPLMGDLEQYINSDDDPLDSLVRSYIVHYQFEAIHPFMDGNGRVGRCLLALMIYKTSGHVLPWLYMSAFYERYREEYVNNLFAVSAEGAWDRWIEFCLRGTIAQANDSIWRCNQFNRLRLEFHARLDAHSPRTHPLVESLFKSPVIDIPSIARQFGITYATAREDIRRLVKAKILYEMEDHRPKSFFSPEIMRIAYGESHADDAAD
ncbi:MAG: Fic family protein [Planctomycetaceae bacterium]